MEQKSPDTLKKIEQAAMEEFSDKGFLGASLRQIVKKAGKAGVELSTLGNKMYEKYKDFKIRDYGYSQFNQYVKSLKHVRVEQEGTILKAVYKG